MSLSFYVATPAPRIRELAALVGDPDWACDDAPADDAPFASGGCSHPYLRGRSARGVEVAWESGELQVRVLTCSSRGDHELATAIVRAIAARDQVAIVAEAHDEPFGLAAFEREFGAAWVAAQTAWGPSIVARMIDDDGAVMTMSGARRDFHLGPRFLGELRARGGDLGEQLMAAFLALQHVDEERYFAAPVMRVKLPVGEDTFTCTAWVEECTYLFPAVDRLMLRHDGRMVVIPYARGAEVAGARWVSADEHQAWVEAVPAAEWPALIERARAFAIA